ncbi:FIG00503421: hypothetical protein, partial [hydrothermal vent metagenome]
NTALEIARPDLSRQTYNLLDVSLRKQPWGRYSSIKEFLEAINEALQNERMLVQSRGDTAILAPPVPRRSRAIILLPLAAIALCIGTFAILINLQDSNNTVGLPVAVDTTVVNVIDETPAPAQSPTIVIAEEESPTTAVSISEPINILAPANAAQFQANDPINFRWTWATSLQENQRFSVYLLTVSGRSLLGTVGTTATDGNYNLQTLLPASGSNAMFEWHVVLEDISTNREIATSNNQKINIMPGAITPTFTPSPDPTATPTNTATPTPIPQIEIILSSGSLRLGPGISYPIIQFLFQGNVVAVLAKDSLEGEWYNIILDDGTRGWIAASVSRLLNDNSIENILIAATIPPRPTNTPTATPTNTATPTSTPTVDPSDGGGNPQPTVQPTNTPPPPPPGG